MSLKWRGYFFALPVQKIFFSKRVTVKTLPNIYLKVALMKKGLSQRDLAFATNIDESRISRIIRGFEHPTCEIKRGISDFLGMKIEELFSN